MCALTHATLETCVCAITHASPPYRGGVRTPPTPYGTGLYPLRDRSVPPTGQVRPPSYRSNPYSTPPTEGSVTLHTFFETPQKQVFSRFVPSIGSCSQFCFILQPHRVAVPFPPTFASPWRSNPWRNNFVEGKIWNHPSKTTMT